MKYAWIDQQRDEFPVAVMCHVLTVSRSGFNAWRRREPSATEKRRRQIAEAAEAAYRESHGIYGYRKVHDDLQEQKIGCCRETVRKALRENGLFSRTKRSFVVTTDSKRGVE